MTLSGETLRKKAVTETVVFLYLFAAGLLALPFAIFLVGKTVFGEYTGAGFNEFYLRVHSDLRAGDLPAWFLVLSPYLVWQLLRLTLGTFRRVGRQQQIGS